MKHALHLVAILLAGLAFAPVARAADEDRLRFDFETGDLQGWQVVEGQFEKPLSNRELFFNHPGVKYNKQGAWHLNTLELQNGKPTGAMTGVIESPVFVLSGGTISLLVGGGAHPTTYVALCTDDGREVFQARGKNIETMQPITWDASPLAGKRVFLRVVDRHPGHWGYLAFDDFTAAGRIDIEATRQRFAGLQQKRRQQIAGRVVEPLRRAILDLVETFSDRYPAGKDYLARLDRLEARLVEADQAETADLTAQLEQLRRDALTANPLVADRPILFVTRPQYINEHGTEATMYQTGEVNTHCFRGGGAIKLLFAGEGGQTTTLLEVPKGVAREPDVHFDGERLVFSMRRDIEDDYHLYEMNADGSGLVQLTSAGRVSDVQPIYLPDGRIAFSSTRDPKYIPCQRHLMANLFVMNGDGSNIRQLGHNTQFEGHASLMPDGRILYTRWEYVDKHYSSAYGLWTMNPDGTNQALYYGGYAWQPGAIVNGRILPGTERFVAVFTAVHELPWGAMVVGDRRRGLDGTEPIVHSWPADLAPYMGEWDRVERIGPARFDSFRNVRVKYEDPYPLSEKHFLCSRWCEATRSMGIWLVDLFGNEVLLHAELPGCFDPRPLAPRQRPPAIPPRVDLAAAEGTFYVQDVYRGQFMDRVPRGTVKWLRVVEAPPKTTFPPFGIGDWTPAQNADGHHPVAVNWGHYNTKRILGKVPVEPDGSAYFKVPAGKFVYFQLLDRDEMMVHSMRSGTTLQPGEAAGCIGCHDDRLTSVPPRAAGVTPLALKGPPRQLEPWYGPPRDFSYTAEVQPVLDKHCVDCHDYGKEAVESINLCGDRGPAFNVSYSALRSRSPAVWQPEHASGPKPLVGSVDAGPVRVLPPYSWGSHRSRLVDLLRGGHEDVELDAEGLARIVTWIDLNTPYYPTYATYYQTHTFGRCPLDHPQLTRLGQLIAAGPKGAEYGWGDVNRYSGGRLSQLIMAHGSPINFTRPEASLVLRAFNSPSDPGHAEALEVIRTGAAMLRAHPRGDMPGFEPCEGDRRRLDYCAERQRIETEVRAAIVRGEKAYDGPR